MAGFGRVELIACTDETIEKRGSNVLDLNEVWKIVKDDYTNGLINSERCLQCSLYRAMRLNPDKTKSSAQIFIEPAIDLGGGKKIYPDMIVCEKTTS